MKMVKWTLIISLVACILAVIVGGSLNTATAEGAARGLAMVALMSRSE